MEDKPQKTNNKAGKQESEYQKVLAILEANKNKSFVKRILDKDKYPILKNVDGSYSTHLMSWGEKDGKYYVFPTVLLAPGGKLKRYTPKEAWQHTQASGNYIVFDNPKDADWFSKKYKLYWRNGK